MFLCLGMIRGKQLHSNGVVESHNETCKMLNIPLKLLLNYPKLHKITKSLLNFLKTEVDCPSIAYIKHSFVLSQIVFCLTRFLKHLCRKKIIAQLLVVVLSKP